MLTDIFCGWGKINTIKRKILEFDVMLCENIYPAQQIIPQNCNLLFEMIQIVYTSVLTIIVLYLFVT